MGASWGEDGFIRRCHPLLPLPLHLLPLPSRYRRAEATRLRARRMPPSGKFPPGGNRNACGIALAASFPIVWAAARVEHRVDVASTEHGGRRTWLARPDSAGAAAGSLVPGTRALARRRGRGRLGSGKRGGRGRRGANRRGDMARPAGRQQPLGLGVIPSRRRGHPTAHAALCGPGYGPSRHPAAAVPPRLPDRSDVRGNTAAELRDGRAGLGPGRQWQLFSA